MRLLDPEQWVALAAAHMKEAPITHEIARTSRSMQIDPADPADPADRFLAATAKVLDLTLVTADERLLACKGIKRVANR